MDRHLKSKQRNVFFYSAILRAPRHLSLYYQLYLVATKLEREKSKITLYNPSLPLVQKVHATTMDRTL